jgi:hypothetical protein
MSTRKLKFQTPAFQEVSFVSLEKVQISSRKAKELLKA